MAGRASTGSQPRALAIASFSAVLVVLAVAGSLLAGASERMATIDALVFGALLIPAGSLLIRFNFRGETDAFDLSEAVLLPTVAFLAPPAAVLAAGVGQAVANRLQANAWLKTSFNVGQAMAATSAGAILYWRAPDAPLLAPSRIVPAVLAIWFVNQAAFVVLMRIVRGVSTLDVLRGLGEGLLVRWGGALVVNASFGVMFLTAYEASPVAAVAFPVPLLLLYWGARGYASEQANTKRMGCLQRSTHALAASVDPVGGFPGLLSEVLDAFECDRVELLLGDGTEFTTGDSGASPFTREVLSEVRALAPVERVDRSHRVLGVALDRAGWHDATAAQIRDRDETVGVLVSYNRGGFEAFQEGELAMLEALANEVSSAIQKSRLLNEILGERQKLADIVGSTSDGIFSVASDGTVTSWNSAMEKMTGHAAGGMVGTAHLSVLRTRDADGNDLLLEGWSLRSDLPTEIQITTKTGVVRWLDCSYSKTGGSDPSLIVVARDTTATRELDQMRREFVATASHELRTPIAPIKGFAHLLLTKSDQISDVERRTGLEVILRQAQRLERLAENVLSVSRIDGVEQAAPVGELDVADVVSKTVGEYRATWADREFVLDADPVRGFGNAIWVEQVLANLLSNALRYSPPGSPVEVTVRSRGGHVDVSVADAGPGIPDDAIDRIFHRFVRLDRDDAQAGSGLGLYISRQLAERMAGSLSVRNQEDGGAVFTLSLPADATDAVVG